MKIFEPTDYANNINWNCISQKEVSIGCSSVCWNPSILDPQTLVVGSYFDSRKDKSELVQIFAYIDSKKEYSHLVSLENGHSDTVTDVEWAPQFGRSFHLIATGSSDKTILIWRVELKYDTANEHFENINLTYSKLYTFNHSTEVIF
jgi:WD40 repeat protein